MASSNIEMVQTVALGLQELSAEMVFVGGSVAELYVNNPAASEIRPTKDVDCVVELSTKSEHAKLEEKLRSKKFLNDMSQGAPICRWIYNDIKVDVMPTDSDPLGFTNRWYKEGMKYKVSKTLPNGTVIYILSPEHFLATKFEAHNGRGGNDLRQSHDFEDIIYILDNCPDIIINIQNANKTVKNYLKKECCKLLINKNLTEGIESALPWGTGDDSVDIIKGILKSIADMN